MVREALAALSPNISYITISPLSTTTPLLRLPPSLLWVYNDIPPSSRTHDRHKEASG